MPVRCHMKIIGMGEATQTQAAAVNVNIQGNA